MAQEVKQIAKPFNKDATYKSTILLLGDTCSGKSTWLTRISTGEFEEKHIEHKEIQVIKYKEKFTNGVENKWHSFQIVEVPAHMKNDHLAAVLESVHISKDHLNDLSAVIFVDITKRKTHENLNSWLEKVKNECGNIPIAVCGNKCDELHQKISNRHLRTIANAGGKYFLTSSKSNYNFCASLLHVAKAIYKNDNLKHGIV